MVEKHAKQRKVGRVGRSQVSLKKMNLDFNKIFMRVIFEKYFRKVGP